jgi:hypothetical protein
MQGEDSKLEDFLRRYFARIVIVFVFGSFAIWLVSEIFFDAVIGHWYARIQKVVGDGDAAARLLTIVLTFWGGLAVTGMWVWRNIITSRQAAAAQLQAEVANRQAEVALKTQISTDLAKAYEQLGSDSMAVRIGAIYTLEKVMRDVQDADFNLYWSIIETLSGFARERSRDFPTARTLKEASAEEAEALLAKAGSNLDICCVLTVIGRRRIDERDKPIDLKGVFAHRFSVPDIALNFSQCGLSAAVLADAELIGYHFRSSYLHDADLSGADLRDAILFRAKLLGVDLTDTRNVTQDQINVAFGYERTKLPDGLTHPEHWRKNDDADS